jgi:hypothetical protein
VVPCCFLLLVSTTFSKAEVSLKSRGILPKKSAWNCLQDKVTELAHQARTAAARTDATLGTVEEAVQVGEVQLEGSRMATNAYLTMGRDEDALKSAREVQQLQAAA